MSCVGRRNSIGRSYLHPTCLLLANAPANSDSVKTNFWLLLTAKAAYPPKTLRSHSWMSWNSRSTLTNDSQLGTELICARTERRIKPIADHGLYESEGGREWF